MVNRLKLNEKTACEAANLARDYQIFDTDVRGFWGAINPSGNRAFTLEYRVVGRDRSMPVEPHIGTVTANYKQRCLLPAALESAGGSPHYRRTSPKGRKPPSASKKTA